MNNIFTPICGCESVDCVFNIIKQFNQHGMTYDEADHIVYLLSEQLKYQKEIFGNGIYNIDDIVVHCEIEPTLNEHK